MRSHLTWGVAILVGALASPALAQQEKGGGFGAAAEKSRDEALQKQVEQHFDKYDFDKDGEWNEKEQRRGLALLDKYIDGIEKQKAVLELQVYRIELAQARAQGRNPQDWPKPPASATANEEEEKKPRRTRGKKEEPEEEVQPMPKDDVVKTYTSKLQELDSSLRYLNGKIAEEQEKQRRQLLGIPMNNNSQGQQPMIQRGSGR